MTRQTIGSSRAERARGKHARRLIMLTVLVVFGMSSWSVYGQPPLPANGNVTVNPPAVPPAATTLPPNSLPAATLPAATLPATAASPMPRFDSTVRIKDIASVQGERVNHVSGQGLVFGLSGTGGTSQQTIAMAANYYLRSGLSVEQVDTTNMSSVLVSGKIPAFARPGETILVTVSVADNATSLRGGTLHQTPLRGLDDEIYAIAQGSIIGGGLAAGGDAANVQINHPTVGVCEAIVERAVDCGGVIDNNGMMHLILRNKSYATVTEIENALNRTFPNCAAALDSSAVRIRIPDSFRDKVPGFISIIGNLRVQPDQPARVVINQKTGVVVFGQQVKISPVLFASENIVIATTENPAVSQPNPLAGGETVVVPRTNIDLMASGGRYNVLPGGMTVGDLANALNALAVNPNTLITIMSSLRRQGALEAELVIE
ncbi:MAG: flagellar basal body P-ring protein FlgI [Planctomycetota bacterium]